GRDSSRDEQGACALLSTQLNALLGERPVTHREVQGNESDVFMEYFPHGITYQEGGVDSAFKPTCPSAGAGPVRKLYQVKGKKNIRASERSLSWASFNTGDCFILDLGETLFVWCGARCNVLERSRAQELAAAIRDSERGGKARLEIVADGEEPPEMLQVLGPKPTLQEGSPEEDVVADQKNAGAAVLYKARPPQDTTVSDATGRMDLSQVAASSPFSQSLLCSDDCFVLDNGAGGKVYVWKGHKANEQERQAALKVAEEVIARMGHSPQTQVEILPQGRETPLFKQFFTSWNCASSLPMPAPCSAVPRTVPSPSPCHPHAFAHPMPTSFSAPCHPYLMPAPCLHHSHPCAIPKAAMPLRTVPVPCQSQCHPWLFSPHAHVIPTSLPAPSPCQPHSYATPMPISLPSTPSSAPARLCHPHAHATPVLLPTPCPCHSHPQAHAMPTLTLCQQSPHARCCRTSATCMP
ncbi:CAPG protein, partial [Anhinga rufa]|nr:CAPG protein [Anhinga rufa]